MTTTSWPTRIPYKAPVLEMMGTQSLVFDASFKAGKAYDISCSDSYDDDDGRR